MFRNILIALAASAALGLGITTMTAPAEAAWCNHHHCYRHHGGTNYSFRIGIYPGYYGYRYSHPRYYGYYAPGCGYRLVTVKRHHHWITTKTWMCY